MRNEEKIENKIITMDKIKEMVKYLEDNKEQYTKLINEDKEKNKDRDWDKKDYMYDAYSMPSIKYTVDFIDAKSVKKEDDYEWFLEMLERPEKIEEMHIDYNLSFNERHGKDDGPTKRIDVDIYIYKNRIDINVSGSELEDEVYQMHSYLKGVAESCPDRYTPTIKNRNIRIQSLCFAIGFVLSYVVFLVLLIMKGSMEEKFATLLFSKYAIVFGQIFVAAVLGNIFGLPIMSVLYKGLIPERESHFNKSSGKVEYRDDVDSYKSKCEVEIGKNAKSLERRAKIEDIFKKSRIVVLVQVIISILLFVILK